MAADMNSVNLVGRLTRDPELKHSGSGDPFATMRVAFSSRAKGSGGQWEDKSNFIDVTVFGKQAETVCSYMSKGRRIGIHGRLSWREWQAQDGSKRQSIEVIANDVYFLDSRADGDGPPPAAPSNGLPTAAQAAEALGGATPEDDVPF